MQSSYVIYNASAGSGKTYGLVKAYLRIVLASKNADLFRSLLAITFTNKAVFEMKSRIIEILDIFSDPKSLSEPHPMFNELCQELKIAPAELIQRSDNVLRHILHNYTSFNISTIDGFNHQLIRNFALDLQLNQFFEVQLDSNTLLQQAVDNLMSLAGSDDQLTKLLTDFSSEKIKDDHHWDTSKELLEVARMLTNENHYWELNSLKNKEFSDFKALKTNLHQKKEQAYKNIKQTSIDFFNLLENNELDRTAFNRGSVFDFFRKLNENPEHQPKWDQQWQENLADPNAPLYGKTNAKKLNTTLIDSLKPLIFQYFITTKKAIGQFNFCKNALRLVVPLALLRQIQNEIERIKEEENILPIWEFNNLISNEITSQPAPFIYERIGERFRHYFIDEFQDTSVLQWNNFIPLILNAVQSENTAKQRGSVLLVGDAKQSIYRWRGGKAEQFMDLYLGESNPFFVKGKVVDLEDNFRSLPTIIDFNNAFFTFVSSIFKSEKYKNLYVNAVQNYPKSKAEKNLPNGFLNIEFVDLQIDTEEENDEFSEFDFLSERELTYCQSILNTIERVNSVGVNDKDITILVRTNKEGSAVASFLSSKGRNIISPDALLLANVPAVRFLISLLSSIYTPKNQEIKIQLLFDFITIKDITEVHSFVVKYKDVPLENFFSDYGFSMAQFNSYSLYEGVVYAVNCFNLARESDAYVTHFLDLIFDFKNARKGGISDFLTFWEEESDKLSISSPEGLDAITIMTVHKSKGLASPVIIYAFADSPLTNSRNQTIWYPVCEQEYSGFSSLLIQKNKNLHIFEEKSEEIINQHQEQQILDQINVLYVGMTRPESFLFIISALPNEKKVTYGTLFKDFLTQKQIWNDDLRSYSFGELTFPAPKDKQTQQNTNIIFQKGWITPNYKIATGAALLWDNNRKESIEKGNLMHSLLSKINFHSDLELVLKSAINEGVITTEHYHFIYPQLKAILNNELISDFFTDKYDYFTEREFLSHNGKYFRPDRIALKKKSKQAFIIDYKTGKFDTKHKHQLHHYAQILSDLGWIIQGKFLVYLDENKVVSI